MNQIIDQIGNIINDGEEYKKDIRKTKSFCEKLISHRHNAIRRQINNRSKKYTGYTYRVIRTEGANKTREHNYPCYFFPWMLSYNETFILEEKKKGRPFGSTTKPKSRPTGPYSKIQKMMTKTQIIHAIEQMENNNAEMLKLLQEMNDKTGTYFFCIFIFCLCNYYVI